ncbi:MAG: LpxL/LpxP family Kdo(2)-lipid IV(A) lauroyl/palmitoleoyl acyltransferase [Aestuariibacter sp.]
MRKLHAPPFEFRFLSPKFWPTWIGAALLYAISWLPYPALKLVGRLFSLLLKVFGKKRIKVAERNLQLCFPEWSAEKREKVLQGNIKMAGMAVIETAMGWWWPDWRVRRISYVEGYEHVEAALEKGRGILVYAIHNMSLELACRIAGLTNPSVAFYRKHDNPLMDYVQYYGRARSNKYMIHKRDVKGMIKALNDGEISYYLPDQDYGRNKTEFVPFFDVKETSTTTGSLLFAKAATCDTLFIAPIVTDKGYMIKFYPGLEDFPSGDDILDITRLNQQVEKMILEAPEQYLWMHKRFKTRPDPESPSLYN